MFLRLFAIIKKEFLHLIRDPRSLLLMFVMPVLLLFIYGYAATFDIKEVPTAIFNQDKTATSRDFISRFLGSNYFILVEDLSSNSEFAQKLDSGKAKVIFNIPADFSSKIKKGKRADVQILIDGSDPNWASSAIGYINSIVEAYYQDLVRINFEKKGLDASQGASINLITRFWYNETLRSINFFVPGMICLILMQMSAILTSLTIVSEREQGTMESLVVSPIRKNELMAGKLVPYVIVAFFDVLLVTAVGFFWFHVPFKGSLILLMLSSLVFLVGAMGLGVLISINSKTSQEAMQTATLATMLPSVLLSGFVFPIENMPWVLQGISFFIPARYFLEILRAIFLKGVGLNAFWLDMLLMTVLSCLIIVASVRKFKKRIE
ncbi:hypothetical protein A3J90_07765 [candidate division WOR-1 bacterium RIFOXYC2_FULL_37_10]|uniref:ABC transmembrane type-2 domain-containing protein n=1 Tax=candidate division WOR-1 bacterium RIFOXYB2_FULL_37_13 TaxID=1802579 RepID=A0A1F4SDZ3_UNCSA|nr:MAG: hypothetical protein A2246_04110 [candidate division WOR-1 bacterium RIFOXYA2_FULL_37_7]OGC18646.1 MAG: hypothetical protein A2310_03375 [candidate division WOR-1 bacterium RIFOXYB2_FULL_37_13]OGC32429.1 MAG: hypothetical protein A3J90_07765 [candidate division WOR-1 bacterium RIFOXYC2_FULL_37_10]